MDNYRSNRGGGSSNYGGDRGRRNFNSNDRGSRRTEMFPAVCDNCGKDCEVPFRPSSDKPIYCSRCFEEVAPRRDNNRGSRDSRPPRRDNFSSSDSSFKPRDNSSDISQLKDQLSSISAKLDKLVRILTPVETEEIVEKVVNVVEVKEEKKPKKVAKKAKKVTKKKAVSKKKE